MDHGLKLLLGLVILGAVLFGLDRCDSWWSNRNVNKQKANINAILSNINAIETGVIAATKEELAAEKMAANIETKALLNAVNATEETRIDTNAALANLQKAKNANATGITVKELEEKLRRLDQ